MMAAPGAIRRALAEAMDAIDGLRTHAEMPDEISPPAAVVGPDKIFVRYDSTFARGSDDLNVIVGVYVSAVNNRTAQDELDEYIDGNGPKSIKVAIEADSTLGGVVQWVRVAEVREYGRVDIGGIKYLGCKFAIEVTA